MLSPGGKPEEPSHPQAQGLGREIEGRDVRGQPRPLEHREVGEHPDHDQPEPPRLLPPGNGEERWDRDLPCHSQGQARGHPGHGGKLGHGNGRDPLEHEVQGRGHKQDSQSNRHATHRARLRDLHPSGYPSQEREVPEDREQENRRKLVRDHSPHVEAGEGGAGDEGGGQRVDRVQGVAEPHVGRGPHLGRAPPGPLDERRGEERPAGHGEHPQDRRGERVHRLPSPGKPGQQPLHPPAGHEGAPDERDQGHRQGQEEHAWAHPHRHKRTPKLPNRERQAPQRQRPHDHRPPQIPPGEREEER